MEYVLEPLAPILRRVRHSRMFSAGIQAEFGLDPRLKHSGVTVLGVAPVHQPQFSKDDAKSTKEDFSRKGAKHVLSEVEGAAKKNMDSELCVLGVLARAFLMSRSYGPSKNLRKLRKFSSIANTEFAEGLFLMISPCPRRLRGWPHGTLKRVMDQEAGGAKV